LHVVYSQNVKNEGAIHKCSISSCLMTWTCQVSGLQVWNTVANQTVVCLHFLLQFISSTMS
jgi:hypothetical protein